MPILELVCGIDEAGRGPLAGPVCAAAVILGEGVRIDGVNDSKKLSAKVRESLAGEIRARARASAIGWASVEEIDALNIRRANLLAMKRALDGLTERPDLILVDGVDVPDTEIPARAIVGGDRLEPTISAASILAKTARDALMIELESRYPGYGFADHKGYGVRRHIEALSLLGPCPQHRRSFRPVADMLLATPITLSSASTAAE